MKLTRTKRCSQGIFGTLGDASGKICSTLEHGYYDGKEYAPKVPEGAYLCVRGVHQLKKSIHTFQTFELTGVPGHTGILFHLGNFQSDSEGCILLGELACFRTPLYMLSGSKAAFDKFMSWLTGVPSFTLTVENRYV